MPNYSGYAPFLTIKEREMPLFVATAGNPKPQTVVYRPLGISDYMFLYTIRGEGICKIANEDFELKEDSLLFVPPGAPHDYHQKSGYWETVYITFNGTAVIDLFKNISTICTLPESFQFLSKYEKIYEYKQNPGYFKEISIETYKLLLDIREFINNDLSSDKKIHIVKKSIKYMEKTRMFNLSEVSSYAGISKEHFCRIFKQYTGYRPSEYMNILKLREAKKLLKQSEMSVGEIAETVGYDSKSYFGMLFKKHIGVTPGEYRNGNFD